MNTLINPNKMWSVRFWLWLTDKIRPRPPAGEAWCVRCVSTGGKKTLVVPVSGITAHLHAHNPTDYVRIITPEGDRSKWGTS